MRFCPMSVAFALAVGLLGCASALRSRPSGAVPPAPTAPATQPLAADGDDDAAPGIPATNESSAAPLPPPGDPRPVVPLIVRLNVYQFTLPSNTVSRDDAFWKHVDEHAVDVAAYDLLYKNGIRVGLGRQQDWDFFHGLLSRQQVATRAGFSTSQKPNQLEVTLQEEQESQEIFWFDNDSFLSGQSYDHCEDLISVYFNPVARHSGDVAVSVVPLLRSRRQRVQYTVREEEVVPHVIKEYPEYLFDLRLRTVIPSGQFLVIAPSPAAQLPHTLGKTFFKHNGKGEEFETLLVISPSAFRLDEPTTQPGGDDKVTR